MNFSISAMTNVNIITPINASMAKGNSGGSSSNRKRGRSQMNRDVDMPKLKSDSSEDIKFENCDDAHENDEDGELEMIPSYILTRQSPIKRMKWVIADDNDDSDSDDDVDDHNGSSRASFTEEEKSTYADQADVSKRNNISMAAGKPMINDAKIGIVTDGVHGMQEQQQQHQQRTTCSHRGMRMIVYDQLERAQDIINPHNMQDFTEPKSHLGVGIINFDPKRNCPTKPVLGFLHVNEACDVRGIHDDDTMSIRNDQRRAREKVYDELERASEKVNTAPVGEPFINNDDDVGRDDGDERDESIGTADEDSDDEFTGPSLITSPTRGSSLGMRNQYCLSSTTSMILAHIHCPSAYDDLTKKPLPKDNPHICCVLSADGKMRHCYTLDTLYKIAIASYSRTGKCQFLQPPHFREPMEDDLLDQIASRFGRAALSIENSATFRVHKSGKDIVEWSLSNGGDVYCCPLCYIEADRRLTKVGAAAARDDECDYDEAKATEKGAATHANDVDDDDSSNVSEECFAFSYDPMTVLGSIDSEQFEVASTFCFKKCSAVKAHLEDVHHVNPKDVSGNDLFHRFQIRASGGLLQSWLTKSLGRTTLQGDMKRFWIEGNAESFRLLISHIYMRRAKANESQSANYDIDEYGDFSRSFPNRARRIWEEIRLPYTQSHRCTSGFIAEAGEEESADEDVCRLTALHLNASLRPTRESISPEASMIAYLKQKRQSDDNSRSELSSDVDESSTSIRESNSSSSSSSDDGSCSDGPPPIYLESEDEDEWMESKRFKPKCTLHIWNTPTINEHSINANDSLADTESVASAYSDERNISDGPPPVYLDSESEEDEWMRSKRSKPWKRTLSTFQSTRDEMNSSDSSNLFNSDFLEPQMMVRNREKKKKKVIDDEDDSMGSGAARKLCFATDEDEEWEF
ncbi:hypothetical protein ACHAWU_010228 [Discostella pseudostelligera]|uniref:Potassium channel tetramerisation-type BTB domain-containing protein n=1 Tax=Discostella pseudostelligera TaxID=259834 RepID=A0ABD3MB31_9STRA